MSWKNKVVWSEGLFLRPQHFQQQERYLESYVEGRAAALHNHSWGLTELTIDRDQLGIAVCVDLSVPRTAPSARELIQDEVG